MHDADTECLVKAIDHTKLMFASGEDERAAIIRLCKEAKMAGFYAVCVRPMHVSLAKCLLEGSPVKVATVIGFPFEKVKLDDELKQPTIGDFPIMDKVTEAKQAIRDGADELDWVIRVADLKADVRERTCCRTLEELKAAKRVADGLPVKVIIETDLLSHAEIMAVTQWCVETGMAMVKTSTGMLEGGAGATLAGVRLIRRILEQHHTKTGIKASGGIKTREQALRFLAEGVDRLGTSAGLLIMADDAQKTNAKMPVKA